MYLCCSVYFTTTVLQDGFADDGTLMELVFKKLLLALLTIQICWLLTVEYLQIKGLGSIKEHFLDSSNWIDLFQLGLTIWLVFIHFSSLEPHDRLS